MGNICKKICGFLMLVAGASLVAFAYNALDMKTAHTAAGLALGLLGVHKLAKSFGMCQCSKDCCTDNKCK